MPKRTIIFGNAFQYEPCTGDLSTTEEFGSICNSTSIFRRLKSKQRFGSWVSFWSGNQISDLRLFAGNGDKGKREGFFPSNAPGEQIDYTLQLIRSAYIESWRAR